MSALDELFWPVAAGEVRALDGAEPTPFDRAAVARVVHQAAGRRRGAPWIALVELVDGRAAFLCVERGLVGVRRREVTVGPAIDRLIDAAVTPEDRVRLGLPASTLACEACGHPAPHRRCELPDPRSGVRCDCVAWAPYPRELGREADFLFGPAQSLGVRLTSYDGVATRQFAKRDVVEVIGKAAGGGEHHKWSCLIVRLRDRRWAALGSEFLGDPISGEYVWRVGVAGELAALWWGALGPEAREALAPALGDRRAGLDDAICCRTCEHLAPHPDCGHTDRDGRCGCRDWRPVPAALAEHRWLLEPASIDLDEVVTYLIDRRRDDAARAVAVVELRDGRWLYLRHDQPPRQADSLLALWYGEVADLDRERLAPRLPPAHRPMALVQLDALLESDDPEVRARAEAQVARLHAAWRESGS